MKFLAAVGLLLAAGVALSGCAETPTTAPEPSPSPAAPSSTAGPASPAAPPSVQLRAGAAGSDGLTVRYQGPDGQTKTLRVEDFRR
jgi:hypothetical protein